MHPEGSTVDAGGEATLYITADVRLYTLAHCLAIFAPAPF